VASALGLPWYGWHPSVEAPEAAAVDRPSRGVLDFKRLVCFQEIDFVGVVVSFLASDARRNAVCVRHGSAAADWMQVVAPPSAVDEVEEVVGVADTDPAESGPPPPLLVGEPSLVGQAWVILLSWDDQLDRNLPNPGAGAKVPHLDSSQAVKAAEEPVAPLAVCV
jgi:hypothetical protein